MDLHLHACAARPQLADPSLKIGIYYESMCTMYAYVFIASLPVRPQIVSKIVPCTRAPSMGANLSQNLLLIRLIIGLPDNPISDACFHRNSIALSPAHRLLFTRKIVIFRSPQCRCHSATHPFEFIFQVFAETRINRFTISDSSVFNVHRVRARMHVGMESMRRFSLLTATYSHYSSTFPYSHPC